jgi:hypothetical protein
MIVLNSADTKTGRFQLNPNPTHDDLGVFNIGVTVASGYGASACLGT